MIQEEKNKDEKEAGKKERIFKCFLKENIGRIKIFFSSEKIIFIASALLIIAISGGLFFYWLKNNNIFKPHYAEAYTLVPDSISQSANVLINLPSGVAKEGMESQITFTPEISGRWVENSAENKVEFDPDDKLEIGKYYTVSLALQAGTMGKDFMGAEDPEVVAIFPKDDSEANENSDITIVFNRPMIPLTTLDVLEEQGIPVVISPKTKGKFKWIGTATLQFISETHLIASRNYEVTVKSDFVSMDGLRVKDFDHKFVTRKLRYDMIHEGQTVYNEAISINFNQPVDLERTIKEISVENETTNEKVDFIAEYGLKSVYNKKTKKYDEEKDEATILIFNKKDRFGREKFWDFSNNYKMTIEKAFSAGGDIDLAERREVHIQVGEVIASLSAESSRTAFVSPSLFDPEGKLWVEFYEGIDIQASQITSDKLIEKGYAEKCKGDADISYGDVECEKEEDKEKIYFVFDKGAFANSEIIKINFEEIKNLNGLILNAVPITKEAVVYPKLKILKTIPQNNSQNVSLTGFIICSNTPLIPPAKEDIDSYLKVSAAYEYKGWDQSVLVPDNPGDDYKCSSGEFESIINYGMMPETDYSMELNLVDSFGQEMPSSFNFRTGKMPENFLNFYHFQQDYNVTTPDKTTLVYAGENMDYVNMNICKLNPEDMLYYLDNKPDYWESPETLNKCKSIVSTRIDLSPRYWIKNYFKIDLKDYIENPRGHFILTFTNPGYKEQWGKARQVYERTYLTVTNLGVVEKKVNVSQYNESYKLREKDINILRNLYWVTNITRLDPVPNARIDLFSSKERYEGSITKQKTIYTDNEGIAKTEPINNLKGAVVSVPNDSAIVLDEENQFEWANSAYLAQKMYVFTQIGLFIVPETRFI